jgi:hypothetical protein
MLNEVKTANTLVDIVRSAFGLLGSGGGLLYLVGVYRKRVRVQVSVLDEGFYSDKPPSITVEAENIGLTATSIRPVVAFKGFLPRPKGGDPGKGYKMVPHELMFNIVGSERKLAPFTPLKFVAQSDVRTGRYQAKRLGFMFFKTYTFSFTRGGKCRIRIRSADRVPLSWNRYVFERLDFKVRGVDSLPKPEEGGFELD